MIVAYLDATNDFTNIRTHLRSPLRTPKWRKFRAEPVNWVWINSNLCLFPLHTTKQRIFSNFYIPIVSSGSLVTVTKLGMVLINAKSREAVSVLVFETIFQGGLLNSLVSNLKLFPMSSISDDQCSIIPIQCLIQLYSGTFWKLDLNTVFHILSSPPGTQILSSREMPIFWLNFNHLCRSNRQCERVRMHRYWDKSAPKGLPLLRWASPIWKWRLECGGNWSRWAREFSSWRQSQIQAWNR